MEQKLKRVLMCLYAIAAVESVSMVYGVFWKMELIKSTQELGIDFPAYDLIGFGTAWSALLVIGTFKIINALKRKDSWSWVGAIAICLTSAPSFALPVSVYGLYLLFEDELRSHFMNELKTKIKL